MTAFDGDQLDDGLTHGDVLLMISAHNMDTAAHALRELLRPTPQRARAALVASTDSRAPIGGPTRGARGATCSASGTVPANPDTDDERADATTGLDARRWNLPGACG